jgi:hypothetical protein
VKSHAQAWLFAFGITNQSSPHELGGHGNPAPAPTPLKSIFSHSDITSADKRAMVLGAAEVTVSLFHQ